jgi:ABC-type antimicrobial peptide transport system permease subunit
MVFFPIAQRWHTAAYVMVRSADPARALEGLRRAVFDLQPDATFLESHTMRAQLAVPLFSVRASATLLASLGVFGLLLASVGLYGVAAHSVAARTREIGTRIALGARRLDVLRLVIGEGMLLVGSGALLGGVAAALLTRVIRSLLYGVSPLDPLAFGVGLGVLASVALLAHVAPARRALRVDPLSALRDE